MKFSMRKLLGFTAGLGLSFAASAQAATCTYAVTNSWGSGFQGSITIANNGSAVINGWTVGWQYTNNKITSSWNATLSGSNPYTATPADWNKTIQPGQSLSFGVQGDTNGGTAEKPTITGAICSSTTSSLVASSIASSVKSSSSSSVASSVKSSLASSSSISSSKPSSSSTACSGASQCNWYGNLYPSCANTASGWGYENGKSCISNSTCASQPAPFGVINDCSVSSSSVAKSSSSISSFIKSSSSSLVASSSSVITSSSSKPGSSSSKPSSSSASSSSGLTAVQLTQKMGVGWNLGNSLDAIGGETAWGNPVVTQQLINAVKAAGFKTIRIPVAWSQFTDANNFVISNSWGARVEEVVNYALNADMYVIINIHWDGGWMQPTAAKQSYVNNRLKIMWTQIATRFQNYDDRLLFAGTNEVMVEGDYGTPTSEYYTAQNSFNQTFVTAVRATGGKNATRHLVVQGFNTNIDHTVNFAKIPTDTVANKLSMEVHYYDPYNFTLNEASSITQWGKNATDPTKTETWANEGYVDNQFQKMKTNFVDKGVGVILGEYGVISRPNTSGHEAYRVYWNDYISKSAITHQLVPVYWDNGVTGAGGLGVFNRNNNTQAYPNLIQALVKAAN